MQTCQPVEQQSMSVEPSCLAGQGQCFCIMTKPTPCLHQSVSNAVTLDGSKDFIPSSTLSANRFFVWVNTSSIFLSQYHGTLSFSSSLNGNSLGATAVA